MIDLTDDDLMRLFGDGDADAFDALFDRYHASVFSVARMILRDAAGAEDVLQETFLAVARSADRYEPRGRFRAWLLRITRNRCLNRMEAQRARRRVVAESDFTLIEPPAPGPDPVRSAEASEETQRLMDAVARLPDRQREAIALLAYEQMRYREIAEVMEMPINTVKTLIHRARAALAHALDDADQEQEARHAV